MNARIISVAFLSIRFRKEISKILSTHTFPTDPFLINMSSPQAVPVSRLHINTDFTAACCDGAPFLPDSVISVVPKILAGQVSDAEWSAAMRHLQSITMEGVPSRCTDLWLRVCFGVCASICLNSRHEQLVTKLSYAIKDINAQIFAPKGLYVALQTLDAGCCSPGQNVLVIALTPEESKILQQETGIH